MNTLRLVEDDDDNVPAPVGRRRAWSQLPQYGGVKRWDGRSEKAFQWDSMHRDRDLWFRNGNCFVFLCDRNCPSAQEPCFKLPLSTLLAAQCHPLVEKFICCDGAAVPDDLPRTPEGAEFPPSPDTPLLATLDYLARTHAGGRVALYMPPPVKADLDQELQHHLAVRNFFAWVFRRPLVGEYLGWVFTALLDSMRQFRSTQADSDNMQDLQAYLEEEGYLDLTGRPDYALAVLQLAETAQHRALYIEAFAHSVGMYNYLFLSTEYSHISMASRNLIRRARLDMDMRLGTAGSKLETFLEEDLSETYLGLPDAARAHLDRFRTYIMGFYTTRFGYYPPVSVDLRSMIFEPRVFQALADDFRALYHYLVDEEFTIAANSPPLAQGGVCVLQSVESFDERNGYPSLEHPLPLLPEITQHSSFMCSSSAGTMCTGSGSGSSNPVRHRGLNWLGGRAAEKLAMSRSEKMRPSPRLLSHAALLRASNTCSGCSGRSRSGSTSSTGSGVIGPDVAGSELVWAYRRFEEETVLVPPSKVDRADRISMVDARKVRWIFIYAVHQTLRNCFLPVPAEVRHAGRIPYHMGISTANLPPWEEAGARARPSRNLVRRLTTGSFSYASVMEQGGPEAAKRNSRKSSRSSSYSFAHQDGLPSPTGMSMRAAAVATAAAALEGREETIDEDAVTESPVTFDLLQPDIDYLGLAKRREPPEAGVVVETITRSSSSRSLVQRSRSLSRSLSRKSAFRRSMALFRSNSMRPQPKEAGPVPPVPRRRDTMPGKVQVVHSLPAATVLATCLTTSPTSPTATTARTLSTSSTNSATSDASARSAATAATTASTLSESPVEEDAVSPMTLVPSLRRRPSCLSMSSSLRGLPPTPSCSPPPAMMQPAVPVRVSAPRPRQDYRRVTMFDINAGRREQNLARRASASQLRAAADAAAGSESENTAGLASRPAPLRLNSLTAVRESMESLCVGSSAAAAAVRRARQVPEWEKFSVGLGGHTVPPLP